MIKTVRLIHPLLLTGHYPPELKSIDQTSKMAIILVDQGVELTWQDVDTFQTCITFVPFHNIVQVIMDPEAAVKPVNKGGRPKKQ